MEIEVLPGAERPLNEQGRLPKSLWVVHPSGNEQLSQKPALCLRK
jgi:hypothetical protein